MNSKYSRLELNKVTDETGTTTDHKTIMQKVKDFYQSLYTKNNKIMTIATQWFFPIYTEISMMLEILGYMDLFLWNLPATNGR